VSLGSTDLRAEIDPLGAQLSTLRDGAGRDLQWDGDPSVWTGRAPVLFPIVGALAGGNYRLDSTLYRLSRHGFARGRMFDVVESAAAAAAFRLRADAATLETYPFRFELDIRFTVDGPTLNVTTLVRNAGDEPMPASFGYHPALRWPLPFGRTRSSHFIEFESDEPAPIRRLDTDGLLAPERHPTPIVHRRLALADDLFQDDAVIFDELRSRSATYGAADGPRIRLDFPDTPCLGIWSKPGAAFVCIEPWHGVADPQGFSGDFRTKPGVWMVAPGAERPMRMSISLLGAGS
jgi:galactose mutarotase-like enzyme